MAITLVPETHVPAEVASNKLAWLENSSTLPD
jgi:hypothetical protein